MSTRRLNLPKLARNARKQVADGVSPAQARQLDKIRKVNDASNTFELIAKEWLKMKDWAEITKTRRLDMLEREVFPAIGKPPVRDNPLGSMTSHSLRQLLKSLGWSGIYSPHTTRTTGSTRLNEMSYRLDAIEAQLAHADTNNVRRTYNHATYLDERKLMMQEWADRLDEWVDIDKNFDIDKQ